jgi:hypothetical protein
MLNCTFFHLLLFSFFNRKMGTQQQRQGPEVTGAGLGVDAITREGASLGWRSVGAS